MRWGFVGFVVLAGILTMVSTADGIARLALWHEDPRPSNPWRASISITAGDMTILRPEMKPQPIICTEKSMCHIFKV